MKIIGNLLVYFLITTVLAAQSSITWGTYAEVEKSTYLDEIAVADRDGVVLWRYQYKETSGEWKIVALEAYGPDLKRIAQAAPPERYQDNYIACLRLFRLGGQLFGLFDGKDGDNVSLFAWRLDRHTLAPVGDAVKLVATGEKFAKIGLGLHSLPSLECAFNPDSTEMAISFRTNDRKKG